NVEVVVYSPTTGVYVTLITPISQTASVLDITASSIFTSLSADAGSFIYLPMDLSVNKNGLSTPLSLLNVTGVRLTYIVPDSDLLDFEFRDVNGKRDISRSLVSEPNGWSIDPTRSRMNG